MIGAVLLAALSGADLAGRWEGAVVRNNATQGVVFELRSTGEGVAGIYDIPDLNLFGEALDSVRASGEEIELRFKYGRFLGRLSEPAQEITAINADWGPPVALHLKRVPARAPEYLQEEVRFGRDGALAGTVYRPAWEGRHPGVVVIHGSGPGKRSQWEYRGLGPMFARMGVVALVYDKRSEDATFAALADDAAAAHAFLAHRPGIDPRRVGFFGTSQGGWLAPLAATRVKATAFLVLEKGAAVTVAEQERQRVAYTMRAEGLDEAAVGEATAYTDAMLRAAESSGAWETVARRAAELRDRPWATHVQLVTSAEDLEGWRRQAYDPAPVLRRTRVPLLALFGEKDTLVPPAENLEKMRGYLAEAGNRDVTLVTLPGEGHNRYLGQHLEGGDWNWPQGFWVWDRVSPREICTIQEWLRARGLLAAPPP
ncbi:MAG TPA: alpha/beta hydrolase [Candidatus Polarisedimenticolaceae bacterium]|nr:alpha/beta hydrolase [Candidatus Polarisedimenticolaceae bacterium]